MKYINSQTGKEVKFGDTISWENEEKDKNGNIVEHTKCSITFNNFTKDILIKKGLIKKKKDKENPTYKELQDDYKKLYDDYLSLKACCAAFANAMEEGFESFKKMLDGEQKD